MGGPESGVQVLRSVEGRQGDGGRNGPAGEGTVEEEAVCGGTRGSRESWRARTPRRCGAFRAVWVDTQTADAAAAAENFEQRPGPAVSSRPHSLARQV